LTLPARNPARLIVVGSSNTDLVIETTHIPRPGETVIGGDLQRIAGGKGANQAVAAARLGASVTFIGRVGDDTIGTDAFDALQDDEIDTTYVSIMPGTPSGIALIAVAALTGENTILVAPGANAHLSAADIDAAKTAFDRADAVLLSLEVPLDAVIRAAELGAQRRIPVILNPAPARSLPPELLRNVSVLIPNETEARQIASMDEGDVNELAAALLRTDVDAAIVTLGVGGAFIATPDSVEHSPAFPVSAVDTVAAGDCFAAAVAVEIAAGGSLRDAVRFGNAAAALKVTRRGAQPGLPTRAEVNAFLLTRSGHS
jgi:ribokinase